MSRGVSILLWLALLPGASLSMAGEEPKPTPTPARITTPGNHALSVKVGDRDRRYIVHVPATYDGRRNVPVVIMLHGGGGTASAAIVETRWDMKSDTAGFLAVFPEGTPPDSSRPARFAGNPQTWNDGSGRFYSGEQKVDDVGFIKELLDDLTARFRVDTQRIYVTGFSNGASMAFLAGIELSHRIAAVAPVAGYLWPKRPQLRHPVSLLYIVGRDDPLVPLDGGVVKLPWGRNEKRPPALESVAKWAEMVGCRGKPRSRPNGEGVAIMEYGAGKQGVEVIYYIVDDMGHTWPGGRRLLPERIVGKSTDKLKATNVIWEFFRRNPKR